MKRFASTFVCILAFMAIAAPAAADRDYRGHHGYRDHPYDRHRHYEYYEHRGQQYLYRGHWRSWNDFDAYLRGYPRLHRYGHYYREQGHLMFRFCDPDSGCFFFSIGR